MQCLTMARASDKHVHMTNLKSICVYCGSSFGHDTTYLGAARDLGRKIGEAGLSLVYGGGSVGLMGAVAKSALDHGAQVTGIIPEFLEQREVMLHEVSDLIVTRDMHERKKLMFQKSDAFVALPGGIGTLEEVVEMMTWAQLGQHHKPVLLANINGFWSPLLQLLDHMRKEAFIRPEQEVPYLMAEEVESIIPKLREAFATLPESQILATSGDLLNF